MVAMAGSIDGLAAVAMVGSVDGLVVVMAGGGVNSVVSWCNLKDVLCVVGMLFCVKEVMTKLLDCFCRS